MQIPFFLASLLGELEVIRVKKTPVSTIHVEPLVIVENTSPKNRVFNARAENKIENRGVLDYVRP